MAVSSRMLWPGLAAIYIGSYVAATDMVAQRAYVNTSDGLGHRRVGSLAWWPVVVATLALGLVGIACWRQGTAGGTWLTLWLTFWLVVRTFYFSNTVRNWSNPDWIGMVAWQLFRGVLLLQGAILTSLLPPLGGMIAFAVVFVLFPVTNLLSPGKLRP
jgi:hypothetical protein